MNTPFRFPADVDGWLTEVEGKALAEWARGKDVLEIGSYCGRSTICLAQTAKSVVALDTFDGRATTNKRDTLEEFEANLCRYGIKNAFGLVGPSQAVLQALLSHNPLIIPPLPEDVRAMIGSYTFDLIFIDGAHDYASVVSDIKNSLPLLRPLRDYRKKDQEAYIPVGFLAFHDYRTFSGEHDGRWDPGVTLAVDALVAAGAQIVHRAGSVAIVAVPQGLNFEPVAPAKRMLAILQPRGTKGVVVAQARDAYHRCTKRQMDRLMLSDSTSLIIRNFNAHLCSALDARAGYPGLTHVAMLHDDIVPVDRQTGQPDEGWADTAIDELEASGADMLSAVVPVKNGTGVTSTAVLMHDRWIRRRLTMKEVYALPETFGIEDIPWRMPQSRLVLNSGLWVMRMDTLERFFPRDNPTGRTRVMPLCFSDEARILQLPNGQYVQEDISEDWYWSDRLNDLGLTLKATRKIALYHGEKAYNNLGAWGEWETDKGYPTCLKRVEGQDHDPDSDYWKDRDAKPGVTPVTV